MLSLTWTNAIPSFFFAITPSPSGSSLEVTAFLHYPQIPTRLAKGIKLGSSTVLYPIFKENILLLVLSAPKRNVVQPKGTWSLKQRVQTLALLLLAT